MPIDKYVIPIKGQASANKEIYCLLVVKYHWFDKIEPELKANKIKNLIDKI